MLTLHRVPGTLKGFTPAAGRLFWTTSVIGFLALFAAHALGAQTMGEALLAFPSQTEWIEWDNLAILRDVPSYSALRQQFAGTDLQQARLAAAKLQIQEEQVDEIVLGSTSAGLYGLFGGACSGFAARKAALANGISPVTVDGQEMFCPGAGICLAFLDDSIAAFWTSEQVKTMLEARQGTITRLTSNRDLANLIFATDRNAPVRGAAVGKQLNIVLANVFKAIASKHIDWVQCSALIDKFGYSVNLDSKAHLAATLECKGAAQAALLHQMLGALPVMKGVNE